MVFEVKIKFTNFSLGAQELITSKTTHAFEQFYLVQGGLRVVRGALHHLQGDELLISGRGEGPIVKRGKREKEWNFSWQHSRQIPAQPNGREVTPSEFSDYVISIVEEVANLHWVVSS